jgi:hypothetical protein
VHVLSHTLRAHTHTHTHPQNDDYFKQLQPLVAKLQAECAEAKYDAKQLVFMLVHLLHFQESALGKAVRGVCARSAVSSGSVSPSPAMRPVVLPRGPHSCASRAADGLAVYPLPPHTCVLPRRAGMRRPCRRA